MATEPIRASVVIDAEPAEVYEFFTSAEAMVLWMGQHASLNPTPGGAFAVEVNGVDVQGQYLVLEPPSLLVFTWGFVGSDVLPPGGSTVKVTITPEAGRTRVEVTHSDLSSSEATKHAPGWRHFLDQLAHSLPVRYGQGTNGS